jgi:AcrR family transcriptional regulator
MPRRYESTEIRQRQIVDAARKVIIKYGSEHVTVKRIAKEVGISETAIYRHFKSKRDILFLLADYIEQSLVEDITKAATKNRKPLEVLDEVLVSHLSAIEQRRGIYFQVIAEIISLGDKKLNGKVAHAIESYIACIKDLLIEGVNAGEIRRDIDLDAVAVALFGIVQGLVNIWALNNYNFNPKERYMVLWNIFREAIINK